MSRFTLILTVNPYATPVDIGLTIKPTRVTENVTEVNVVAITTHVSNDFKNIEMVLCFSSFPIFHFQIQSRLSFF